MPNNEQMIYYAYNRTSLTIKTLLVIV